MLSVVVDDQARAELTTDLDELFREGARRMLAAALEAEVEAYIATHAELVDEHGHRLVVRNGHAPARTITTGVGQVEVVRPQVDDRRTDPTTGERRRFQQGLDALPILDVCAVDPRFEHQPLGVNQEVSLATFDLLGAVVSSLLSAYAGRLGRLAVYDTRAGLGVSLEANPRPLAQGGVHPLPCTI